MWGKGKNLGVKQKKVGEFVADFLSPIRPWMKDIVSKYKESELIISYPTSIAEFYDDALDKEIALFSTMCMDWSGDTYSQINAMRRLMGEHPWEWFSQRIFVSVSQGDEQDERLASNGIQYWKIAKFFDKLYSLWRSKKRPDGLRQCFPTNRNMNRRTNIEKFVESVLKTLKYDKEWEFKAQVLELVLRTPDGIGMGLWKGHARCPRNVLVNKFLHTWVDEYRNGFWSFDNTVLAFCFDKPYDFFYFTLAWDLLRKKKPAECSVFSTLYGRRYSRGRRIPREKWKKYMFEVNI